jgi:hypothetical protein
MSGIPQEELCPGPDSLLGELYKASPQELHALVEGVPAQVRAMLAVYCCRRTHLAALGVAVASTCKKNELIRSVGEFGVAIFARSREAPPVIRETRRKVTLPSGLVPVIVAQGLN